MAKVLFQCFYKKILNFYYLNNAIMQNSEFKLSLIYIIFIKTVCVCIIAQTNLDTVLTFKFVHKAKENFELIVDKILIFKNKLWFIEYILSALSYISNK